MSTSRRWRRDWTSATRRSSKGKGCFRPVCMICLLTRPFQRCSCRTRLQGPLSDRRRGRCRDREAAAQEREDAQGRCNHCTALGCPVRVHAQAARREQKDNRRRAPREAPAHKLRQQEGSHASAAGGRRPPRDDRPDHRCHVRPVGGARRCDGLGAFGQRQVLFLAQAHQGQGARHAEKGAHLARCQRQGHSGRGQAQGRFQLQPGLP